MLIPLTTQYPHWMIMFETLFRGYCTKKNINKVDDPKQFLLPEYFSTLNKCECHICYKLNHELTNTTLQTSTLIVS